MANIGFAMMNSKGQLMIPSNMRGNFVKDEKLFLLKNNNGFILRKMKETKDEDIEFAYKTEEAWKRIEKGKAIELEYNGFLKQLEKW